MNPGNSLQSVVELSISCKNLKNLDKLSKSDPCCVVALIPPSGNVRDIGRTETVMNSLDPAFSKKIEVTYLFEERQLLRFSIYDVDSSSSDLSKQDFIGHATAALGEIVSYSSMGGLELKLKAKNDDNRGTVKIIAEELQSCKEAYVIEFCAGNLPSSFMGGEKNYFFEIHKKMEGGNDLLVHRSHKVQGKKFVQWAGATLSAHSLCNNDMDRLLELSLWKYKSNGSHKQLGSASTNLRTLLEGKSSSKNTYNFGKGPNMYLNSIVLTKTPSFLDYIQAGIQIHCFCAVDFTASNGDPRNPSSLHFFNPNGPNQYQMALHGVLDIIQDYDSDKMFPALGFGGYVNGATNHCFFLNGHDSNAYCAGTEGVMQAYKSAIGSVRLSGPTNFAPMVNHVASFASAQRDGKSYFILLILTDGAICDMADTADAIVAASGLPMSIIIVGVGNADFDSMERLDADDHPLRNRSGHRMSRDIVQFVPFARILNSNPYDYAVSQSTLAREVLAEVPKQFLSYMKKVGVYPESLSSIKHA